MTGESWIDLHCHPSTPTEAVHAIQVAVRRSSAELQLTFRLDGDIPRVTISPPSTPRFARDLWQHTCFEAFIAINGQAGQAAAYHEFNFAPSGEWTVYAFRGYRDGVPVADETLHPNIATRSTANRPELDAVVPLDRLSAIHARALLRIGLSAVVETIDGLSYWALRHPKDKPDFHNADGFTLSLEPPGPEE
jgi:hypothetical protein